MNYIYTTPLTSERYLSHHGILGQKWGIRRFQNKDGSLTEAGKKRYTIKNPYGGLDKIDARASKYSKRELDRIWKASGKGGIKEGAKEWESIVGIRTILKEAKNDPELKSIRDKAQSIEDDLSNDFSELNKKNSMNRSTYAAIAGIASALDYYKDLDMEMLGQCAWFYACDDGDQGYPYNSSSVYANQKGIADKAINGYSDFMKLEKEYSDLLDRKFYKPIMESYGHTDIDLVYTPKSVSDKGCINIDTMARWSKDENGLWPQLNTPAMYSASETYKFNPSQSKRTDEATSIFNKMSIKNYHQLNSISESIEDAGLKSIKVSDMTDSDWTALNNRLASY